MRPKYAYLGPAGTFTEEATRTFLAGRPVDLIPLPAIGEVLQAVEAGVADAGVIPLENSFEGTVSVSLDGLVHDVTLNLVGEIILPIRQMLLARPDVELTEICLVRSHPQALAQCRQTLARLLPGVPLEAAASTANAARAVAGERAPVAAVAPGVAAALYGLRILARDIHDSATNATRFGVVGRQPVPPTGDDKTTIVFSFEADRPGSLYEALGEFARRGINLTKLESRPARLTLGRYLFFADLEGHREDAIIADAFDALSERCAMLRVLGSYPRARQGGEPDI